MFCEFSNKEDISLLTAPLFAPFMCHGSSTEDFPVHRNHGHFFQNAKKYMEMGNGYLYDD